MLVFKIDILFDCEIVMDSDHLIGKPDALIPSLYVFDVLYYEVNITEKPFAKRLARIYQWMSIFKRNPHHTQTFPDVMLYPPKPPLATREPADKQGEIILDTSPVSGKTSTLNVSDAIPLIGIL